MSVNRTPGRIATNTTTPGVGSATGAQTTSSTTTTTPAGPATAATFGTANGPAPQLGAPAGNFAGGSSVASLLVSSRADPNAPVGAQAKANQITQLLSDDDNAKKIINTLSSCSPPELNDVLSRVDVNKLFSTVHNHKLLGITTNHDGDALAKVLTSDANLPALSVAVRTHIVDGLQKTDHGDVSDAAQAAITRIFVGTRGADLTALKNGVDLGDDMNNMHHLVYSSIDNQTLRNQLLQHISQEAAAVGKTGQTKGFFDVDDTFYVNFVDNSYPRGTAYPGVIQFHKELDLGPNAPDRLGDNTFLSARPHDHLGLDEKATLSTVHSKGEGPAAVITGDVLHLIGNQAIADAKIKNFNEASPLYPEYGKVFQGDSGQGDVLVAVALLQQGSNTLQGAFIHELPNAHTDPALRAKAEALGVVFYDTAVGAGLAAYQKGLISKEGLLRIADGAQADFAKVDFGGDDTKKAARKAELDRDCAAVKTLLHV